MNPTVLPDKFLRLMSRADRESLGKAGRTAEEAIAEANTKAERELQTDVAQYLRLLDVPHIIPPYGKRSSLPEGWCDVTLAYRGVPVAIEVKGPTTRVMPIQHEMHAKLRKNGWRVHIVRSLQEVQAILRGIDAEIEPKISI